MKGINFEKDIIPVDDKILDMVKTYGFDPEECRTLLLKNKFCSLTTIYYLCLKKYVRENGKSISDLESDLFEEYINNPKNKIKKIEEEINLVDSSNHNKTERERELKYLKAQRNLLETTKKKIFEPLKLNNMTLKNRLLRSATWEGIAALDGSIDERTYSIYEELAKGGVGGIITGFTSVSDNDTYFEGMMRLSNDKLIPQYKKLTEKSTKRIVQ